MTNHSLLIKHTGTGKEVEYPLLNGTLGAESVDLRGLNKDFGCFSYDPGFTITASCKSKITYIDGDRGILLYRGYPIEQLAENCDFVEVAYLLLKGELPNAEQFREFNLEISDRAIIHEALRKFFDGFHYDAHPMAMLVGVVGSLAALGTPSRHRRSSIASQARSESSTSNIAPAWDRREATTEGGIRRMKSMTPLSRPSAQGVMSMA